jgi:hypothetical protein
MMTSNRSCEKEDPMTNSLVHLLLWPVLAYWRAYAISVMWGWFVKPATGIATPSIYLIAGVCITLALALPYHHDDAKPGDRLATSILMPLIVLGFGSLWHWLQFGV